MNREERNALIEEYGRGYDLFAPALAEIPRKAWDFKPALNEWSIHETIIHMADSESIGATRARILIAQPGTTLMAFDDVAWCARLDYKNQNVDDALLVFKMVRLTTYHLLKALPDETFSHTVVHPERGYPEYGESYTLEKWLRIYTRHARDHIEQLKKNYQSWEALAKQSH
jgi:hypothetical protein